MIARRQETPKIRKIGKKKNGYTERANLSTEEIIALGSSEVWARYQELIKFFNLKIKYQLESYMLRATNKEIAYQEICDLFGGMVYVKDTRYKNGGRPRFVITMNGTIDLLTYPEKSPESDNTR